jgi:hypothetical protein
LDFKEIKMSKKLIVAMALSLVLVSGGLFSAQADCGLNPCGWHLNLNPCSWHWPSCLSCRAIDTDKSDAVSAYDTVSRDSDDAGAYRGAWPFQK